MRSLPRPILLIFVAASLAACSGAGTGAGATSGTSASTEPSTSAASSPSAESSPSASASASVEASSSASASTGAAAAGVQKVSANTASKEELISALTAAGVPNPERWADEIEEYRPYDASDASLQKLRDNLAKYDPSPETLQGILSALQP